MLKKNLQLLIFTFLLFVPAARAAGDWHYPISKYTTRQSYKTFGQNIDKQFYAGREKLFPNQFLGFHAAVDLEIVPEELNQAVPVYAVASGKIVYASTVTGYGGLILEQLPGTGDTALYGHVKLTGLTFNVGDSVAGGSQLTVLGDAFTSQTGGERKHLHFGIYKDTDLYFKGYEPTRSALDARWLNPTDLLTSHSAVDPLISPSPLPSSVPLLQSLGQQPKSIGFFDRLGLSLRNFLQRLFASKR
jgi:murein DD-endopeptidase MepM/ murein hydrolase activator NlpD